MKKNVTKLLCLCLVLLVFLAACGNDTTKDNDTPDDSNTDAVDTTTPDANDDDDDDNDEQPQADGSGHKVIGVAMPHMSTPARVAMVTEIENTIKDMNLDWEISLVDGQNDLATQINGVEDLIQKNVDAIVLCPINSDALVPVCEQVMAADIPLVLVDRNINESDAYTVFVGGDNVMIGELAAEYIGEALGGTGKVAILEGSLGNSATNDRQEGFMNVITEKYPDIEIVADQTGEWARDVGMNVMEDILQANTELDALYSHGDNMTLGAIQAIMADGRDLIIVSADGQREVFDQVKNGVVDACIFYPGGGQQAIELLTQIFAGETVDKIIQIEVPLIDANNVDELYEIGY